MAVGGDSTAIPVNPTDNSAKIGRIIVYKINKSELGGDPTTKFIELIYLL